MSLLTASCPRRSPPAPDAQLAVVLTADLRGYLEPCGCSEHMLGGLDRAAGQIELAKKELGAAIHASAGDVLFDKPAADEAHAQQERLKARALLQAFAALNTAAMAVGPRDLALGAGFIAGLKPPFPLLEPASPGFVVVERGGIKVGFAAGADRDRLLDAIRKAKSGGAEVVFALALMPLKDLVAAGGALRDAGADLALVGHQAAENDGEEERDVDAALPVLSVKSRGRSLLRVDLHRVSGAPPGFVRVASDQSHQTELSMRDEEIESLGRRAHQATGALKAAIEAKIAEKQAQRDRLAAVKPAPPPGRSWLSDRFVELSDEKPSSPAVRALVDRYTAQVAEANLAFAKAHGEDCPAPKAGEPGFVGTATCVGCHAEPGEVWKGTGHGHAYATLEAKHKQYDLDCIRCHVVGVDQPGGVCRVDKVSGRENVGCESCHGPGSLHAGDPEGTAISVKSPGEEQCLRCHTRENSPQFDYAAYRPRILGPGHGLPFAKR